VYENRRIAVLELSNVLGISFRAILKTEYVLGTKRKKPITLCVETQYKAKCVKWKSLMLAHSSIPLYILMA
jgi:hypothetical protein